MALEIERDTPSPDNSVDLDSTELQKGQVFFVPDDTNNRLLFAVTSLQSVIDELWKNGVELNIWVDDEQKVDYMIGVRRSLNEHAMEASE